MKLIKFSLEFYEDVVDMFYNFTREIFGDKRRIGSKYFFYKEVNRWIEESRDIIISVSDDGKITGYSMSYIDRNQNLTETIYNGEMAYVKPEYRKTRAAFMLYKNVVEYAKELNLNLIANGRVENNVDSMIEKHFDCTKTFISYERSK